MKLDAPPEPTVRLDQWLHATRFFKTRALAAKAVKGHKVLWNTQRVKPSRAIKLGDHLTVTRGEETFDIQVLELLTKRVSAPLAAKAYLESDESRARREAAAEDRRVSYRTAPRPEGRPNKRDRRRLIRFVRKQSVPPETDEES
ncbi:MAG: RNA-binding S4 domain-containing protein [Gammaproteobacteria bacterium]